jgi:elongation factor Ts
MIGEDGKRGVMIELNSETDFVAKTDEFNDLGKKITAHLFEKAYDDPAALLAGGNLSETLTAVIAKLGENIVLKRFARFDSENGKAFCYIHSNYKVGALAEIEADKAEALNAPEFAELGHEICMQIAAANPLYLVPEDAPEDVLEREKAVYRQQLLDEGKPADKIEKIIPGKIRKYFDTTCLLEQEYIRDSDKKVKDLIAETGKKLGAKLTVKRFERFGIGE